MDLREGFSPAIADCEYRAPLTPRLARPGSMLENIHGGVNDKGGYRGLGSHGVGTHMSTHPAFSRPRGEGFCIKVWWGRGDSNSHALRHVILSHARLPIPTLPHIRTPVHYIP